MKKYITGLVLSVFLAGTAHAAGVSGSVATVNGDTVTVEVKEKAGWLKKGAKVKVQGSPAMVTAAGEGKYTVKCTKASGLKAGDAVTIIKGADNMQGC